ncbi:hypothetical protein SNEBB_008050 [Seison nebaliae]|nr:hypothetical protein SNEBB_008050 [Seison nebaliae]
MNFRKLLVKFIILFTLLCCSNQVNGRSTEKVVTKGKDVEKSNPEYGFIHALTASFSVVLISEIGDKTFFIAAIYAMQYSRLIVFLGSMTALGTMTILSAYLGNIITIWLPRHITILCSSVLFIFFGMKMLYEAKNMENENADDELEDVRKELYNERSKEFIDNCDQENWWSRRCRPFRICSNFIQSGMG